MQRNRFIKNLLKNFNTNFKVLKRGTNPSAVLPRIHILKYPILERKILNTENVLAETRKESDIID